MTCKIETSHVALNFTKSHLGKYSDRMNLTLGVDLIFNVQINLTW